MGALEDSIRSIDFIAESGEAAVHHVLRLGVTRAIPRGRVLWLTGDPPRELVVPVTGRLKTVSRSPQGHELVHELLGPGSPAGLPGVLDGLPRATDAETVSAGEFFVIPRGPLLAFLHAHPEIHRAALRLYGLSYRRSVEHLQDVVFRHAGERLARFLVERACVLQGDGARVLAGGSRSETASRLAMTPEVVSRQLGSLVARGVVVRTRRATFVRDWAALCATAGRENDVAAWRVHSDDPAPDLRTRRYFLPMSDRVRRCDLVREAAYCRSALTALAVSRAPGAPAPAPQTVLAACRARGCPAALASARVGVPPALPIG